MGKAWNAKAEFVHLSGELAETTGIAFQRLVLPLVRILWPKAVMTQPRARLDRLGIDIIAPAEPPYEVVIQCKGLEVSQDAIGPAHIRQFHDSLAAFARGSINADVYLFVHNREHRDPDLWEPLAGELRGLVQAGRVTRAEIWDRQRFLNEVFERMRHRVQEALPHSNISFTSKLFQTEPPLCAPLEEVPLRISRVRSDQHRLRSSSDPIDLLADPVDHLQERQTNLCVVLGEAGYGKTTAAVRALSADNRNALFLPATAISRTTNSTKDLLEQCLHFDTVFENYEVTDRPVLQRIARPVIEFLLKDPQSPVSLVVDGIDESFYLARRGGIQRLLNTIRDVKVPVVLTCRTELWNLRQADFATLAGVVAKEKVTRWSEATIIELLPWGNEQILRLTNRFRETFDHDEQRKRLGRLMDQVAKERYEKLYGDIPRRPLFLRYILETVAEMDVHELRLVELFRQWAFLKIRRDLERTLLHGGPGRVGILPSGEGLDTTCRIAFRAMQLAARLMTQRHGTELELLPTCKLRDLLTSDPSLAGLQEPAGLLLNSLLVPVPSEPFSDLAIRFAHRSYQEYFLASYLRDHVGEYERLQLPRPVAEWLSRWSP